MSQPKTEITAEAINQALQAGAKSLTGIATALGFKSGSSSTLKRIIAVVPDIQSRLPAANPPAKEAPAGPKMPADPKLPPKNPMKAIPGKKPKAEKSVGKKPVGKGAYPIPDCVPYRPSSDYAKAWAILYAHREKGISRSDYIERYRAWVGKPLKNCEFDCHVVSSPRQDGSSHRSASRASGLYYCVKENDWIKLVLLSEKK